MPLGFLAFAISTVWRAVELLDRRDSGTMDAGTGDGCGVGAMCASDRWPAIGTATARDLLLHAGEIFQSTRWRFFVSFFPVFALILFRSSLCCFLFPRFCVARVEVC